MQRREHQPPAGEQRDRRARRTGGGSSRPTPTPWTARSNASTRPPSPTASRGRRNRSRKPGTRDRTRLAPDATRSSSRRGSTRNGQSSTPAASTPRGSSGRPRASRRLVGKRKHPMTRKWSYNRSGRAGVAGPYRPGRPTCVSAVSSSLRGPCWPRQTCRAKWCRAFCVFPASICPATSCAQIRAQIRFCGFLPFNLRIPPPATARARRTGPPRVGRSVAQPQSWPAGAADRLIRGG